MGSQSWRCGGERERDLLLPLLVSPHLPNSLHPLLLFTLSFCLNFSLWRPALNSSQLSGSSEGNSDCCSMQAAFLLAGFVSQQLSSSLMHLLGMQQAPVQTQCSKEKTGGGGGGCCRGKLLEPLVKFSVFKGLCVLPLMEFSSV